MRKHDSQLYVGQTQCEPRLGILRIIGTILLQHGPGLVDLALLQQVQRLLFSIFRV